MNEKKEEAVYIEMTEGEELTYETLEELSDGKGEDEE